MLLEVLRKNAIGSDATNAECQHMLLQGFLKVTCVGKQGWLETCSSFDFSAWNFLWKVRLFEFQGTGCVFHRIVLQAHSEPRGILSGLVECA